MYRVILHGAQIALEDKLAFVRKQANGFFVRCSEEDAQGIVVGDSAIYHLYGKPSLDGAETVYVEEFSGQSRLAAIAAEGAALASDLNDVLTAARAGLVSVPTPGEAWSADLRYITGDTATVDGVSYTALKYSKGKNPPDSPNHWEVTQAPSYPAWDSIEDGTVIMEGEIVTYNGATWQCTSQHIKSNVYKPKSSSSKWVQI